MSTRVSFLIVLSFLSLPAASADNAMSPTMPKKPVKEKRVEGTTEQVGKQTRKPAKAWFGKPIHIKKLTEQQPLRTRMRNEIKEFVNSNGESAITGVDTVK